MESFDSSLFFGNGSPLSKYTKFFKTFPIEQDLRNYFGLGKNKIIRIFSTEALTNKLSSDQCYYTILTMTVKSMKFFKRKQKLISNTIKKLNNLYPSACKILIAMILKTMESNYNEVKQSVRREMESYQVTIEPALKKQNQIDSQYIEQLQGEIYELQKQLNQQTNTISTLTAALSDKENLLLQRISIIRDKNEVILTKDDQINDFQNKLDKTIAEFNDNNKLQSELEMQISKTKSENIVLQNELQIVKQKQESDNDEFDKLLIEAQKIEKQKDKLDIQNKKYLDKIKSLEKSVAKANDKEMDCYNYLDLKYKIADFIIKPVDAKPILGNEYIRSGEEKYLFAKGKAQFYTFQQKHILNKTLFEAITELNKFIVTEYIRV